MWEKTFKFNYDPQNAVFENGHEYVDLGLSVKWAFTNLGAASVFDSGSYFAWGESCSKQCYNAMTYTATSETLPDAANKQWGGRWRTPTKAEFEELLNSCKHSWSTCNGVLGMAFWRPDNKDQFIFLPAGECLVEKSVCGKGMRGNYWSRDIKIDTPYFSYCLEIDSERAKVAYNLRFLGLNIRPVFSDK